jgi:hypothetical protein
MGCCGQNRAAARTGSFLPPRPPAAQPTAESPPAAARPAVVTALAPGAGVALRYLEGAAILVRGPATGAQYRFTARNAVQVVDARDAEGLLRSRLFRRSR